MDDEKFDRLFTELAETRRHFDVVAEGFRSDVRQVAEGVESVISGLQRVRSEAKDEFTEMRSMIKVSYSELDRRLSTRETSLDSLATRVERLEATG